MKLRDDWRTKSKPIPPGGTYPAKDHCRSISSFLHHPTFPFLRIQFLNCWFCSKCGLCDTYYVAHVKNACAFLGDGMSRIEVSVLFTPNIFCLVLLNVHCFPIMFSSSNSVWLLDMGVIIFLDLRLVLLLYI